MSGDSMLIFHEADASAMAELFSQKATLVRNFIPDVSSAVTTAVGDWTGESREACDAALERLKKRGEELSELMTAASEASTMIKEAGNKAEAKAFAHVDS